MVKIVKKAGSSVAAEETVLILEAMKMETEVSAPKAGTIGSVNVSEGDSVAVGDVLFTIA